MFDSKPDTAALVSEEPYKGEAIRRAGRTLDCFSAGRPVWTLDELARETGTPRATLRGIVDTLVSHGMLRRTADDAYRLGFAWLRVATRVQREFDARTVAMPLMRRIRDAINETVILSLRVDSQRVHLDYVESTHSMRRLMQVGSSSPLHVGATGRALLGVLPAADQTDYLERAKAWLSSDEHRNLEGELAAIRREGFASAIGSVNAEMATLAAATRLPSGECIAITISCPMERFDASLKETSINLLMEAMTDFSIKVGAKP